MCIYIRIAVVSTFSVVTAVVYCVYCRRSTCLRFTDLVSEHTHQAQLWVERAGILMGIRRLRRHKRYPTLSTHSTPTREQRLRAFVNVARCLVVFARFRPKPYNKFRVTWLDPRLARPTQRGVQELRITSSRRD